MMMKTFFNRLEGYHRQIVSRDTLIDAQKHPEKHKDLIVRVAGYSAFFNVLSKATQDDIIERTEQDLEQEKKRESIIDTVDLNEIKEAVEYMPIVGVTSNPSVKKDKSKGFL